MSPCKKLLLAILLKTNCCKLILYMKNIPKMYDSHQCYNLTFTQVSLSASQGDAAQKAVKIERLTAVVKRQEDIIRSMEDKLREHEMTRRNLHNTIQELKVGTN